jgi:hypothetical protein
VAGTAKIIEQMRRSPQNVRFDDLARVKGQESDDDA